MQLNFTTYRQSFNIKLLVTILLAGWADFLFYNASLLGSVSGLFLFVLLNIQLLYNTHILKERKGAFLAVLTAGLSFSLAETQYSEPFIGCRLHDWIVPAKPAKYA